jgi:two-component sensor histidine kinase
MARSRIALQQQRQETLEGALREVCAALHSQAEPRSILISLEVESDVCGLSRMQIITLALIVNELVTNAIKHAFAAGRGGRITIAVRRNGEPHLAIIVDDDGIPFPDHSDRNSDGLGLGLVGRLMESIGGLVILPANGSKTFEMRVPVNNP